MQPKDHSNLTNLIRHSHTTQLDSTSGKRTVSYLARPSYLAKMKTWSQTHLLKPPQA